MPGLGRSLRFSLQAKVMAVVAAALVAMPVVTLAIFDGRLRQQMRIDANLAMSTARGALVRALDLRARDLIARFRLGRDDPRFLRIVRLQDAATMQDYLRRAVLDELRDDTEVALFVTPTLGVSGARRDSAPVTPEDFAKAAGALVRAGLGGEEQAGTVTLGGAAYHVVAIPAALPEGLAGVLVFGIRLTGETLHDVRPPLSELLVLSGERVLVSTIRDPAQNAAVVQHIAAATGATRAGMLVLEAQRFEAVDGMLNEGDSGHGLRYVLLTSVEQRLSALEQARLLLLGLSATGIVLSAGVVWFFVRRITRPLTALRDRADAVGRGDFSQRIARFSNDECGDLAKAFNRMTGNLEKSRSELEVALQQVRATQNQLIQSEKLSAVGQFIAGVAHELNNPLTVVVGFAETLQTRPPDGNLNTYLSRITKAAHRCHKIVHSLLSFARQHAPERKPVDLAVAMDEVLEIMGYDLRTGNITVRRDFARSLPLVLADGHQLQQVFINIIGNARQAMESFQCEGVIDIHIRPIGDTIEIEFADNGPGIKPEHLPRLFDPFFTTKPVGKGTGLGLSLCYGIVQEHAGKISARSDPGCGATFRIELPVAQPADDKTQARGATAVPYPEPIAAPSGRTILVIDDEPWILELATDLLRRDGHAVETAPGGEQAVELLARRSYDAVVADWKMPGLNGVRLFEHLRTTDPASAQRMIFMTGDVVNEGFQQFLRENRLSCLSKPFATGEFRAAIGKMCPGVAS